MLYTYMLVFSDNELKNKTTCMAIEQRIRLFNLDCSSLFKRDKNFRSQSV